MYFLTQDDSSYISQNSFQDAVVLFYLMLTTVSNNSYATSSEFQ